MITSGARKVPRIGNLWIVSRFRSKALRSVRCSKLSVPSDGRFIVKLGRCNSDRFEHVVGAVSFQGVVVDVILDEAFGFLRRGHGTLFKDSLLNSLVAKVIHGCIENAFDRGDVDVEAQIA